MVRHRLALAARHRRHLWLECIQHGRVHARNDQADNHDFMSYGGPTQWVSSRTWIRLFNAFTGQNLSYPKTSNPLSDAGAIPMAADRSTAQEPRPYLSVGGEQDRRRVASRPRVQAYVAPARTGPATEVQPALLNADGESLFVRRFVLGPGHIDTLDRSGLPTPLSSVKLLPLPDGVATLALRRGEDTLATVVRSPNAPAG